MTNATNLTNRPTARICGPTPPTSTGCWRGEHHDPHSILGAHEYGDHTVIRAFRPHAVEVVALVGDDRYPLQHIESGLFAVAVPFTDLDRLPAAR